VDSRLAWRLFQPFLRPWMGSRLRVHMTGLGRGGRTERRVVLCANHESFWDGFLLQALQRRLFPDLPFHAVMLRSELEVRPWLALLGAIGAEPGSIAGGRRMLRAVRTLRAQESGAVLGYFPQGRIRPGDPRPLGFRTGVVAVAEALAPVTVLPVGIRVLPGRTARMDAFLSVGGAIGVRGSGVLCGERLESAVALELNAIRAHVLGTGRTRPRGGRVPRAGSRGRRNRRGSPTT